jgi:cell division protein FtsW (lipid II flippase)
VRLEQVGVHVVEAYTLPSALVLVAVGLWRLRHDDEAATVRYLAPGLTLATVPSLLVALGDPASPRALLLGAGCLALLLAGAALRWSAPLVVGAVVGAVLVLRELAPYAAQVPTWLTIGLSGAVLLAVGITWESRMGDLRRATHYLAALR